METSSLQSHPQPQQSKQQEPQQQQQSSSKNLKNWFDEFKARVSKKSQTSQLAAGDQVAPSQTNEDEAIKTTKDCTSTTQTRAKSSSLRSRRVTKISVADCPDFDTSSINTIFNRRDSRYEAPVKRHRSSILSGIFSPIKWIIFYLIPFNYNLPWKLLCLINSSFIIIVIGLASGSPETSKAFSFFNGFVCGLTAALVCFIILALSFIVYILPKSRDSEASITNRGQVKPSQVSKSDEDISFFKSFDISNINEHETSNPFPEQKSEDFTQFEILDDEDNQSANNLRLSYPKTSSRLDNDDHKGWMIEFIGDYESRNSSDIKLKSIFVRIENRVLYLCKTKSNYDAESTTLPVFTSQRVYDLNNVEKFSANLLIPKSVRNKQKYVWSKKYPIKLEFQSEEYIDGKSTTGDSLKNIQLTLFARSCREKEEWFRRFKRIVEGNRFGVPNLKCTLKSEESIDIEKNSESLLSSFRRFRCQSPSQKKDQVQTSQSSHLLSAAKKLSEDDSDDSFELRDMSSPGLVRTKSCELLNASQSAGSNMTSNEQDPADDENPNQTLGVGDESTLTKETAELFSQAIEYSNFLDSQPTLNYKEYIERVIASGKGAAKTSDWFNALTGRIFFDVFSQNYWSVWFKRKIQRKLYRIRLPYFMETLTLTQIDLGKNAPQFLNVVSHNFDSLGLSIDFDMSYSGGLTMTFETKLNLLKIKSDSTTGTSTNVGPNSNSCPTPSQQQLLESLKPGNSTSESSLDNISGCKPPLSSSGSARTSGESTSDSENSDSDSSSDSSVGEADLNEISDWEDYGAEKTRQNIVKFVDKIASSRYFQHATENRYIKKKLQDISNCPLVLVVQIQSLNGILTLNVPPPQTDRIWYGFKPMPELILKALPKMGDREVNLSHVTDWIERKLSEEFRKILVMPNMEDIVLPVLKSDHLQYVTATK